MREKNIFAKQITAFDDLKFKNNYKFMMCEEGCGMRHVGTIALETFEITYANKCS